MAAKQRALEDARISEEQLKSKIAHLEARLSVDSSEHLKDKASLENLKYKDIIDANSIILKLETDIAKLLQEQSKSSPAQPNSHKEGEETKEEGGKHSSAEKHRQLQFLHSSDSRAIGRLQLEHAELLDKLDEFEQNKKELSSMRQELKDLQSKCDGLRAGKEMAVESERIALETVDKKLSDLKEMEEKEKNKVTNPPLPPPAFFNLI